jgi:hypothetical protein
MMQVDEGIAIYQVGCFILLPTYLPPLNLQSIDVTILAIPSLDFLIIIKFQIHAIHLTQLAKKHI